MIIIHAANQILESPVVATLLAIIASGVGAAVIGVFRIMSRVTMLESKIGDMAKDVSDLKHDMDIIKWGAVAGAQVRQQQQLMNPGDQS